MQGIGPRKKHQIPYIWQFCCFAIFTSLCFLQTYPSHTSAEPLITNSVVKLKVPIQRIEDGLRRHFTENCSAFITLGTEEHYLVLSSWHCIDGYQTLKQAPQLIVADRTFNATIEESGQSMADDWLLAKISRHDMAKPIVPVHPTIKPVTRGEIVYGFGWGGGVSETGTTPKKLVCRVTEAGHPIALDCGFRKGDSGGLIARINEDRYEAVGIISAGDSDSTTLAFPIADLPKQVWTRLLKDR